MIWEEATQVPKHIVFMLCVFGALSFQMSLSLKSFIVTLNQTPTAVTKTWGCYCTEYTLCVHAVVWCMQTISCQRLCSTMQSIIIQKHPSFSACDTTRLHDIIHYTCAYITTHVVFWFTCDGSISHKRTSAVCTCVYITHTLYIHRQPSNKYQMWLQCTILWLARYIYIYYM